MDVAPRIGLARADALAVQTAAAAIPMIGRTEPHWARRASWYPWTAQARRPLLAVFHEASSVVEILRSGRPPRRRCGWSPDSDGSAVTDASDHASTRSWPALILASRLAYPVAAVTAAWSRGTRPRRRGGASPHCPIGLRSPRRCGDRVFARPSSVWPHRAPLARPSLRRHARCAVLAAPRGLPATGRDRRGRPHGRVDPASPARSFPTRVVLSPDRAAARLSRALEALARRSAGFHPAPRRGDGARCHPGLPDRRGDGRASCGSRRQATAVERAAATLDALLGDRIAREDRALLKLDLEGHELPALRGARRVLEASEVVVVEVQFFEIDGNGRPCFGDVHAFFRERGFELYDVACLSPAPPRPALAPGRSSSSPAGTAGSWPTARGDERARPAHRRADASGAVLRPLVPSHRRALPGGRPDGPLRD